MVQMVEQEKGLEVSAPRPKHLFVKGQSGNPAGRPKGIRNFTSELADAIHRVEKQRKKRVLVHYVDRGYEKDAVLTHLVDRLVPALGRDAETAPITLVLPSWHGMTPVLPTHVIDTTATDAATRQAAGFFPTVAATVDAPTTPIVQYPTSRDRIAGTVPIPIPAEMDELGGS